MTEHVYAGAATEEFASEQMQLSNNRFTATLLIRATPNHASDLCQPGKQAVCQACQIMRQVSHHCKVLGNKGQGAVFELLHLH